MQLTTTTTPDEGPSRRPVLSRACKAIKSTISKPKECRSTISRTKLNCKENKENVPCTNATDAAARFPAHAAIHSLPRSSRTRSSESTTTTLATPTGAGIKTGGGGRQAKPALCEGGAGQRPQPVSACPRQNATSSSLRPPASSPLAPAIINSSEAAHGVELSSGPICLTQPSPTPQSTLLTPASNWDCLHIWGDLFSHIYSEEVSSSEADMLPSSREPIASDDMSSLPLNLLPAISISKGSPSVPEPTSPLGVKGSLPPEDEASPHSSHSPSFESLSSPTSSPFQPPLVVEKSVTLDSSFSDPPLLGGPASFWALNVRSLLKHAPFVFDLVESERPAFLALTETWLPPGHSSFPQDLTPEGYVFFSTPRVGKGGGGVGALSQSNLNPLQISLPFSHSSYELLALQCRPLKGSSVLCCVIYHPPHHHSIFLDEFTELCDFLTSTYRQFLILGDLNIHVNIAEDPHARSFRQLLELRDIGLLQDLPTHERGNCLDLILFKGVLPHNSFIHGISWSDHALVGCVLQEWLPSIRPKHVPSRGKSVQVRPWKTLDLTTAQSWLSSHPSYFFPQRVNNLVFFPPKTSSDPCLLSADLSDRWIRMRDECCPVRTKRAKPPSHLRNLWYTDELLQLKRLGRRLERRWRKSRSLADRDLCKIHLSTYKTCILEAKKAYLTSVIASAPNETKTLFKLTKEFTISVPPSPFSEDEPTCNDIMRYFGDKITKIRDNISSSSHTGSTACNRPVAAQFSAPTGHKRLSEFITPTVESLSSLILQLGPSSSVLDPLPTSTVKNLLPALVDDIWVAIDTSLRSGVVPTSWKRGIITPLLKKPTADPKIFSNLRPVSQLPLLARIAEAVIVPQLQLHCEETSVFHDIQSGFRPGRGTETALVDVHEQISSLLDAAHPAALVLLDLSAAFDTIDHGVLLERLEQVAGISATALNWFGSFLADRSQQVRIGAARSEPSPISCGVPQGSALSPILFNIYMRPLANILEDSGLGCQAYADDTQLVVDLHQSSDGGDRLVACLERIQAWMSDNWLKLNESKTEIILFGTPSLKRPLSLPWPASFGPQPAPVPWARNLGVRFHQSGDFSAQVSNMVSAAHHQLNGLGPLMPLLSPAHRALICRALALSRICYCNALLAGLPARELDRLQKVQNRAVRLIWGLSRRDHVTEARKNLGWLRVIDQIKLKCLTMAWRALHNIGPDYLQRRLSWKLSVFPPRTIGLARVVVPRFQRVRRGGRTFSALASRWWNDLPPQLRQVRTLCAFKRLVKRHLATLDGMVLR